MNDALIPKIKYRDASIKHSRSESWLNFAARLTKNPFVKNFLHSRDGDNCQWCGRRFLQSPTVHHVDYDYTCIHTDTIRIANPTEKRPNRTAAIPDCESCANNQPQSFNACMSRLVLVHSFCNMKISKEDETLDG